MNYNVTQEKFAGFSVPVPLKQTNSQDTYGDKQSGSLVEMSYKIVTRSTQIIADISINVALVESNVFTVPGISHNFDGVCCHSGSNNFGNKPKEKLSKTKTSIK